MMSKLQALYKNFVIADVKESMLSFMRWKLSIFKIIDGRMSFYCNNFDFLPYKPKFTFRHLKKGIQEFHRRFVLAPTDKAYRLKKVLY